MRLIARSAVLFPQPDGPMMAVTFCLSNFMDRSFTARKSP
jgi:hypothetical protein